jgi:hypothetical protein
VIDPVSVVFLLVIVVCVSALAYLLPQDPAVVRVVGAVSRWRHHRQLRRWVERQRHGRP